MKRIFVVGCPRSGTTLVQGILGNHPDLTSYPESHIFTNATLGMQTRKYGWRFGYKAPLNYSLRLLTSLGIASPVVKSRILSFSKEAELPIDEDEIESLPNRLRPLLARFVALLDSNAGKIGWVEKTPNNIFCIPLIEKHVPNCQFIHVIRDGEAVTASIMDAAKRYESWNDNYLKHGNSTERVVALWNRSVKISLSQAKKQNHLLVRHEDLTQKPENEVKRIMDYIGVDYDQSSLQVDTSAYIVATEKWKLGMGKDIKPQKSKFTEVFDNHQQHYIRKHLIKFRAD